MRPWTASAWIQAILAASWLACGGGGGTGTPPPVVPAKAWTPPVATPGYYFADRIGGQVYGADGAGNRHLLLVASSGGGMRLFARRYPAAGQGWQSDVALQTSQAEASAPYLSVASDGGAVAVWRETLDADVRILAARYLPDSGWSAPQELAAGIWDYSFAGREGRALLVLWDRPNRAMSARRFSAAGGWSSQEALPSTPLNDVLEIRSAIDASGNGLVLWSVTTGGLDAPVWASACTASGGWTAAKALNQESTVLGTAGYYPRVAMRSTGEALVTWAQFADAGFPAIAQGTYYRTYAPASGWSAPEYAMADVVQVLALGENGKAASAGLRPNPHLANAVFQVQTAFFSGTRWSSHGTLAAGAFSGSSLGAGQSSLVADGAGNFHLGFIAAHSASDTRADAFYVRYDAATGQRTLPLTFDGQVSVEPGGIQVLGLPGGTASALWFTGWPYGFTFSDYK
ncbi:MAG TPA: hypothetical protein VK188_10340 [Holophaga sp.]|nr:hypothetical protein [Holophaga sp.]